MYVCVYVCVCVCVCVYVCVCTYMSVYATHVCEGVLFKYLPAGVCACVRACVLSRATSSSDFFISHHLLITPYTPTLTP